MDEVLTALQHQHAGRLCLCGPPGTGKTALAAHIAHTLGMPLLVKSASACWIAMWAAQKSCWLKPLPKPVSKMPCCFGRG